MKGVKKKLLNKAGSSHGLATEMAHIAGYSTPGAFLKMLRKEDGEIRYFQGFVDVVKLYFPDEYLELMSNYTEDVNPDRRTAVQLLEFLSVNRQLKGLKILIDKMLNSKNSDWAKAYLVQYEYQNSFPHPDYDEFLKKIKKIRTTDEELSFFINNFKATCYVQKGNFSMTADIAEDIEYDIEIASPSYIVDSLKVKYYSTMSSINLRVYNRIEKARQFADNVLEVKSDISSTYNGYANFIKGYSYLFESHDLVVKYLKASIDCYKGMNNQAIIEDLEEKIELANVHWGKQSTVCKYPKNESHRQVISEDGNPITTEDDSFSLFLKGKRMQDKEILFSSFVSYLSNGDTFLSTFPRKELLKLGYNKNILNSLIEMKSK